MVDSGEGAVCSSDFSSGVTETFEGLRRCDFVDKMSVNVEEGVSSTGVNDVVVEDLVVEGSWSRSRNGHVD